MSERGGEKKKTKKKKEKIPHMCEGMDHGHLWVRCPKTDSLALIQVPEDGSMTAIEKKNPKILPRVKL